MKKLSLTIIAFCCLVSISYAQWVAQPSNISPNFYVQFIDAVDTNVVWGLVADPANQLTPVQEFTKTVDGGNLWVANPIANALGLSPSGLYALNADTAWVVMFNGTSGGGSLLKTVDGGTNWNTQPTAAFAAPAGFPNIVHFFDANNGITMGDPNGGYFEIYTTNDGGTNWVRTPQANIATQLAGEFGITSVYTAYGDSTLWFGTNLGRIYKTIDRGLNWTVASTPYTGFYIGDIAFRDENNGIASNGSPGAGSDIIRTIDGGATWSLVSTNTVGILNKLLTYVPGTDSTYFLSSPQLGGGTAFSQNDGNYWAFEDNLIHSDIEFVSPTVGWTGSNEINAPMFKWNEPVQIKCASLLGPLQFSSNDSICTFESVDYSIHIDFTNEPRTRLGFNAVIYDEFYTQIGAQTVYDLVASGYPNSFVPDPGQTTIGTLNFTIFFNVAATSEVVHFAIQAFPTQCTDDTSNFIMNSVFQDITGCATALVQGTSATVDLSGWPQTGQVTYNYSYSVNGVPQI
nr:YCF48-related protein [Bacteroidia bacterium]